MLFCWIPVLACLSTLWQAGSCNCTLVFLVGLVGYLSSACFAIMRISDPHCRLPVVLGTIFIALLGALAANGIWMDVRYLGRIAEYRYCVAEAILMMLFLLLQMLPQKQEQEESLSDAVITCDG